MRWVMVIDLRKCVGCGTCAVVCGRTNKVPTNLFRRVVDCGTGALPDGQRLSVPISCMHCKRPACLEVCPTRATYHRQDGIVDIRAERCVGCGSCIVACPYIARTIVFHNEYFFEKEGHDYELRSLEETRLGVSAKCNFCMPRIDGGIQRGLTPGSDPEATPVCVISCSSNALYFGDLDDPQSTVSTLLRENGASCLQEDMNTEPSMFYIME